MWSYIIQGFLLGLAYVAPIGAQNIFGINTALTQPRKRTFLTSLIIAAFDVPLYFACFYGIGALIGQSELLQLIVMGIGSPVVVWIGIGILCSRSSMQTADVDLPYAKVISTVFAVTWLNPQAIIDGTMMMGASRASVPAEFQTAFVVSAASASALWWLCMPQAVGLFRGKIGDKFLRGINIVCGSFIVFYGCRLLYSGIKLAIAYFG